MSARNKMNFPIYSSSSYAAYTQTDCSYNLAEFEVISVMYGKVDEYINLVRGTSQSSCVARNCSYPGIINNYCQRFNTKLPQASFEKHMVFSHKTDFTKQFSKHEKSDPSKKSDHLCSRF